MWSRVRIADTNLRSSADSRIYTEPIPCVHRWFCITVKMAGQTFELLT